MSFSCSSHHEKLPIDEKISNNLTLLTCTKCNEKIHPKFKNAKCHKVIDIKELGQIETTSMLDFK